MFALPVSAAARTGHGDGARRRLSRLRRRGRATGCRARTCRRDSQLDGVEGTGEVQTPLHGPAAARLRLGDHVYFRHVKAGELCEHFDRLYLVAGSEIVDELPTYRGEGRSFL